MNVNAKGVVKSAEFDVSNKVWKEIDKKNIKGLEEQFKKAIENGFVGPKGEEGIKQIKGLKYKGVSYDYEVKILGKNGEFRMYGNKDADGVIKFTKFGGHK